MRILLVDDNHELRELMADALSMRGNTIVQAIDGTDGLYKFQHNPEPFDVVISDLEMPLMDGIDLVKQIRKRNSIIPIYGFTGADMNKVRRMHEAGCTAVFDKDFANLLLTLENRRDDRI